jgi:hypothetical protein
MVSGRGSALIWSEMCGLPSSIVRLRTSDFNSGDNFDAVNWDLEALTLALSQNNYSDGGNEGIEEMCFGDHRQPLQMAFGHHRSPSCLSFLPRSYH